MRRLLRIAVAVVLLLASVGMLQVASSVWAQPPGFDKEKGGDKDFDKGFDKGKGFEKGKGVDRQTDKSRTPPTATDPVKSLEADLEKLKASRGSRRRLPLRHPPQSLVQIVVVRAVLVQVMVVRVVLVRVVLVRVVLVLVALGSVAPEVKAECREV
jgi:hypothetical protein